MDSPLASSGRGLDASRRALGKAWTQKNACQDWRQASSRRSTRPRNAIAGVFGDPQNICMCGRREKDDN